jgi:Uma2 family endonuclease
MSETIGPSPEGKLIMTTAPVFPQADPWTIDDLDRLPDGVHAEIIDGSLILSAAPTPWHQLVEARLMRSIGDAAPPEFEVIAQPGVEVLVSYLEPDLVVARADAIAAGVKHFRSEDLLLVVEIVSPSSVGLDRREKPIRYGEVGIPYFWRIELAGERAPFVVPYRLVGGVYVELDTVHAGDEQTVDIGFPVTLRPAELVRRRR